MNDNSKLTIDDNANFIWLWDDKFFLETNKGNFVWSDPNYNGDNTITPFPGSFKDYIKKENAPYGRCKGIKNIRNFCGSSVIIK